MIIPNPHLNCFPTRPAGISAKDFNEITNIHQAILINLSKGTPTIADISKKAGMSASKFRGLFLKLYGETYNQYFLFKKMELAKHLLVSGECSVTQAAYQTGFAHAPALIRVFKKYYHATPSTFKNLAECAA